MWGDTVVFSADSSGDGNEDINYIDVTRPNQIQPLSEDALWEQSPAIWRDVAAWEIGPSTGDMEIGVQRVGEPGPPQVLTNDSLEQVGPRVWGEWVVWQELNAGQTASAVVAHNLITGEEIRVDRPGLFDGGASVFADTLSCPARNTRSGSRPGFATWNRGTRRRSAAPGRPGGT